MTALIMLMQTDEKLTDNNYSFAAQLLIFKVSNAFFLFAGALIIFNGLHQNTISPFTRPNRYHLLRI